MLLSSLWSRWRGATRPASVPPVAPEAELAVFVGRPMAVAEDYRPLVEAARALPDGAPCDPALVAAIDAEMMRRRIVTGTQDGPALPKMTELVVRHAGLPDWWHENGNLLLCGVESQVEILLGFWQTPCRNCLAVIGSRATPPRLIFEGEGGLVAIGDGCGLMNSGVNVTGESSIMIGENSSATYMNSIDVRNGGIVVVGDDNMWAMGVSMLSDDTHAIRDAVTDRRINEYGGRIVIDRHVWLGNTVQVMGHCRIGHDGVVGQGSLVKGLSLPPNAVSAGRPAKPVRSGITWNRQDLP